MNKEIAPNQDKDNAFKTPSKALVRLYGLLAIIIVIIPEWLAEITLGIENRTHNKIGRAHV